MLCWISTTSSERESENMCVYISVCQGTSPGRVAVPKVSVWFCVCVYCSQVQRKPEEIWVTQENQHFTYNGHINATCFIPASDIIAYSTSVHHNNYIHTKKALQSQTYALFWASLNNFHVLCQTSLTSAQGIKRRDEPIPATWCV